MNKNVHMKTSSDSRAEYLNMCDKFCRNQLMKKKHILMKVITLNKNLLKFLM